MIKICTTLFFTILTISLFGQYPSNLKIGLYNSFKDVLDNSPQFAHKLQVRHRSTFDIQMFAGNDYQVSSDTLNIKKRVIKKCFAVFNGDSLYINGKYINGCSPFCKVENNKRFLIIKAGVPSLSKRNSVGYEFSMAKIEYFPGGGALGGAATGAQLAMIRLNYILDCKNGSVKILTKDYLINLLKEYPDLKLEFESRKEPESQTVLLEFLNKINSK